MGLDFWRLQVVAVLPRLGRNRCGLAENRHATRECSNPKLPAYLSTWVKLPASAQLSSVEHKISIKRPTRQQISMPRVVLGNTSFKEVFDSYLKTYTPASRPRKNPSSHQASPLQASMPVQKSEGCLGCRITMSGWR